jgi:hypothetical protein
MKRSSVSNSKRLWVAVKVERGFVGEARIFESFDAAKRTERKWRANLNPDYDEAAVVEGHIARSRRI